MRALIVRNPKRRLALRQMTVLAAGVAPACVVHGEGPTVTRVYMHKFTSAPDKITLRCGVPMAFKLTGQDILMGFSTPNFNMRANVVPGQTVRLALMPDKTGTFDFLYDILYGFDYEAMNGTLTVA